MRAIRFDEYGGRDVLHVAEVDIPDPGHGEVLVQVKAAATNPGEAAIREGAMREGPFTASFPSGQGSDLAGIVTQLGSNTTGFAVGEEVLGWSEQRSSQAEYVTVPTAQLIAKPSGLSWEVAGSLFVIGVTAYAAVRAVAAAQGDRVAVSAAAGGVGSVVVQLLRVRGAQAIGIASPSNHDWLRSVGAIPVAYGDGLADRIRDAAPDGLAGFIDCFGPDYVRLALDLGVATNRIETIIAFQVAAQTGVKAEGSSTASTPEVLAEMAQLVASGQISVPIAATYPLDRVREAYAELEQRHTHGKIVLIP